MSFSRELKDKLGLSTNSGLNYLAVLIPALELIREMPEGHERSFLLFVFLGVTSLVCWLTRGTQKVEQSPDLSQDIHDVLDQGRK